MARTAVIIVAGGVAERFGRSGGKQLAPLCGRPVLAWSVENALALDDVSRVIVACHPGRLDEFEREVAQSFRGNVEITLVPGGNTRQDSVWAALSAVGDDADFVVVHDGARPLASSALFRAVVDAVIFDDLCDAAVVGHASVDTLKFVEAGVVSSTPDRSALWAVQTPQAFRAHTLRAAHLKAREDGYEGTDDASLVERIGGRVCLVEGPRDNIKITMAEDLAVAEAIINARRLGDRP